MGSPLLIHPDILFGFHVENAITTLSSPEASLCREEGGEKEKERARGTMGKGKEKRGLFPLPIVPRALAIFRLGIPSGSLWGGLSDYHDYPNW